jgi:murein DD-endopeptidase MepM/ murein hydrolase activator NlpD
MKHTKLAIFLALAALISACAATTYGTSASYAPNTSNPLAVTMPANAPAISQQFRVPPPGGDAAGRGGEHLGIDILAAEGTRVISAAPGRVVQSFFEPAYGNRVVIDHGPDENGLRITTIYKHLQQRLVTPGTSVERGQHIAALGKTGVLAGGIVHLHFEVYRAKRPRGIEPIDPHLMWQNGVGRVSCHTGPAQPEAPLRLTYPIACK